MPKYPYSVLLRYPDYANNDGEETYYALVEAESPEAAVEEARAEAVDANSDEEGSWIDDPLDFALIAAFAGWCEILLNQYSDLGGTSHA